MPKRKYQDLSHLSPEEYYKEAQKRKNEEKKEYYHKRYISKQDLTRLEEKKRKLEEAIKHIADFQKKEVVASE